MNHKMLGLPKRSGSRLCKSRKSGEMLEPVEIGYLGQSIRKFVDVGPGWLLLTEAKWESTGVEPQIFFLGKKNLDLTYLFDIESHNGSPTGFCYSRASNTTNDGVFFSDKLSGNAISSRSRCLRWEVAFD